MKKTAIVLTMVAALGAMMFNSAAASRERAGDREQTKAFVDGVQEFKLPFAEAGADWYFGTGRSMRNYDFWVTYWAAAFDASFPLANDGSMAEVRAYAQRIGASWLRQRGPGNVDEAVFYACVYMKPLLDHTPNVPLVCDSADKWGGDVWQCANHHQCQYLQCPPLYDPACDPSETGADEHGCYCQGY